MITTISLVNTYHLHSNFLFFFLVGLLRSTLLATFKYILLEFELYSQGQT